MNPVEEMIGILMTQMWPHRHLDIRREFATLATAAIVDSSYAGSRPVHGYVPLERD